MKTVNIYNLTRISDETALQRLERQMSMRRGYLKIKDWEVKCLKKVADHLFERLGNTSVLDFFYSFQIPKLGKEFDLLRISEDTVINIELKSGDVSDEKIKRQLLQNRYYLSSLGRNIRSYTYVSAEDRLLRLTGGERLIEESWDQLVSDLLEQSSVYEGHIEKLFLEENFLISPITDPDRFLRRDYFLTSQQSDIKNHILRNIKKRRNTVQAFTGLPGTGKTLLLYDLAMILSERELVCVLHYGSFPDELEVLNRRLKRIDFIRSQETEKLPDFSRYQAVFIDEGHRLTEREFDEILQSAKDYELPVIISYDNEEMIAREERIFSLQEIMEERSDFVKFKLTNRIRTNSELSNFIQSLMHVDMMHRKKEYPSVDIAFATTPEEVAAIIGNFKSKNYIYVRDQDIDNDPLNETMEIESRLATCREFDRVVMVIDQTFYYDECNYLRNSENPDEISGSAVSRLFHGLSRAKTGLGLIIYKNPEILDIVLDIVSI